GCSDRAIGCLGVFMSNEPAIISWSVKCESPDEANRIAHLSKDKISLQNSMTSITRAYPNGIEVATVKHHRLSDYFERIDVLHEPENECSAFHLIFQPRAEADH